MRVEVIYIPQSGTAFQQIMELSDGATVEQALQHSQLYKNHPEATGLAIGIYGKLVTEETKLKDGDRVELYRPLTLDPKDKRRKLAKAKKR